MLIAQPYNVPALQNKFLPQCQEALHSSNWLTADKLWIYCYHIISKLCLFPASSAYSGLNGIRPLRFSTVRAEKCHHNPDAVNMYHKTMFHEEANFTREEALQILQDKRNNNFRKKALTTVGKLCDVTVNPEEFRQALLRLNKCNKWNKIPLFYSFINIYLYKLS